MAVPLDLLASDALQANDVAVRRRVEGVDVLALWRRNIPVGPEQLVEFPVLVAEVLFDMYPVFLYTFH